MNLEAKARHRKVMRALKEEEADQEVWLKKKYKNLIDDNVKDGLYPMEYILEHKLYLPEPPAIIDAELKASGKIKTIGKEAELFDARDARAHFRKKTEKIAELRKTTGDTMLDDDVLMFNSLKAGEKIRMVDETPLYIPVSKPKHTRFDVGKRPDEALLGPFAARIQARADDILRRHPPMRGTYRLAPELDKEVNERKEEKKELMKKSEKVTQRHLYNAEMGALLLKAEDFLLKPTYMPKTNIGIPENPFRPVEDETGKKKTIVRDEEIEELLNQAEAKIGYKFDPKKVHDRPRSILVMGGDGENTTFDWFTEQINNRFAAEEKRITPLQREVRGVRRNVADKVTDMRSKNRLLSLANGLTYKKDSKIHPEAFGNVTKELEAVDARERLKMDVCDVSKRNLKAAFGDQPIWREDKERRDKARFYEAGIIPGRPQLQEEATTADKVVDDYLKGRIRV